MKFVEERHWYGRWTVTHMTVSEFKSKQIKKPQQNLQFFVDVVFDCRGTKKTSNQSPVLSVCKINTINFSHLSDSIFLFQLYGQDSTKGALVKCVTQREGKSKTKATSK